MARISFRLMKITQISALTIPHSYSNSFNNCLIIVFNYTRKNLTLVDKLLAEQACSKLVDKL
jgi:hypothetical protein